MEILRFGRAASLRSLVLPSIFYLSLAVIIVVLVSPYAPPPSGELIGLSLFAFWRYGWQLTHFVRAAIYANIYYPSLRYKAQQLAPEQAYPQHIYFVIPSYKEDAWVSIECIHSILSNMANLPIEATLVIPTGADQDDAVIARAVESHPANTKVNVVLQRQKDGKRIAMGHALRAVARRYRDEKNSVTVFMDGDSYLETDTLKKLLPLFAIKPNLGAVTTNETAFVDTQSVLYRDWFNLKFGQRHILFQSHSLSNKVLTLTGRFSVFRTSIVVNEDFISRIEVDSISHARHGKFRFLMGDDKSSWFSLLKDKWHMLYLPDVLCYSLESRDADFFKVSMSLPYRWYGNTLRNNARALALGWRTTGLFIWVAILDQRLSMWTSLVGIVGAIVLSVVNSMVFLPLYLSWVLLVRTFQMMVIALAGHRVTLTTIPLMLYGQWYGAIVKIRAFYNLNDQNWSKGAAKNKIETQIVTPRSRFLRLIPKLSQALGYAVFIGLILFGHSVLKLPSVQVLANADVTDRLKIDARAYGVVADDGRSDSAALNTLIQWLSAYPNSEILLPSGVIDLSEPILINKSDLRIKGQGQNKTVLRSRIAGEAAVLDIRGIKHNAQYSVSAEAQLLAKPTDIDEHDWVLLQIPNTENFLTQLGSEVWSEQYPYVRQQITRVEAISERGDLRIKDSWLFEPTNDMTLRMLSPVQNVVIEKLSIEQLVNDSAARIDANAYENSYPDHRVDAISVFVGYDITIRDLDIRNAGRHPMNWEYCYRCRAKRLLVDGAWNKGSGGNGYIRFNKTFNSQISDSEIYNIRHIVFQWAAANNRIDSVKTNVDINFHGGFSQHNVAKRVSTHLRKGHLWPAVYVTPNDAKWAPPDGAGNRVNGIAYPAQHSQ